MNRFVWNFFLATTVFVFANGQLCLAQIEIVDGDGKQVTGNEIPAEVTEERPATGEVPRVNPQIFGGNGSRIIIRKSFTSVDENGERKTKRSGKAIVVGPDGERQEFDLGDDQNMGIEIPGFGGMLQVPDADPQTKPRAVRFSLGCRCDSVHPAVASQLGLESGLMVVQMPVGSAAAEGGVQKHDVLLFADDKQLTSQKDLNEAVQAAGEAEASISLTLIRGGKEMSVVVTPEKSKATTVNRVQGFPDGWNLELPRNLELPNNGMFDRGMGDRMRQQMEQMQNRMRQLQGDLENGM